MGHRAYILNERQEGGWEIYYTHWGAGKTFRQNAPPNVEIIPWPVDDVRASIDANNQVRNSYSLEKALIGHMDEESLWVGFDSNEGMVKGKTANEPTSYDTIIPQKASYSAQLIQNLAIQDSIFESLLPESSNIPRNELKVKIKTCLNNFARCISQRSVFLMRAKTFDDAEFIHNFVNDILYGEGYATFAPISEPSEGDIWLKKESYDGRNLSVELLYNDLCDEIELRLDDTITQIKSAYEEHWLKPKNQDWDDILVPYSPLPYEKAEDYGIINHPPSTFEWNYDPFRREECRKRHFHDLVESLLLSNHYYDAKGENHRGLAYPLRIYSEKYDD